jgi:hypothetical protein
MRKIAIITGSLLILLGTSTYFMQDAGQRSPTALIPAVIGMVFAVCGAAATTPKRNMLAMHIAALFALVGTAPLGMALPKLLRAAGGQVLARPEAVYAQLATGVLCLIFLILAIRSFVTARLLRKSTGIANG